MVTTDEMVRGGKKIPLKKIVDEAIKGCSSVKHVLVQQRNRDTRLGSLDVPLLDVRTESLVTMTASVKACNELKDACLEADLIHLFDGCTTVRMYLSSLCFPLGEGRKIFLLRRTWLRN